MRKLRKVMALLMTLAMVMGLSLTAFADTGDGEASITVKGLTKEPTTVSIYKVIDWNEAESSWTIENWAQGNDEDGNPYVDDSKDPYVINWEGLRENIAGATVVDTKETSDGNVLFSGLDIGAYLIVASGNVDENGKTVYSAMGTYTYKTDPNTHLMVADQKTINAKGSNYTLTKTYEDENDSFVGRGDTITYNIETVFQSFQKGSENRAFSITDTPSGITIKDIKVYVGDMHTPLNLGSDYTLTPDNGPWQESEAVTVNFTETYLAEDGHAANDVKVAVTAQVTGDGEYSNSASSSNSEKPTDPVGGDTGSIQINKKDEDGNSLAGATFSISSGGSKLSFVQVEGLTDVYRLATQEEVNDENVVKVQDILLTTGTLVVKGLDEGTYEIVEEEAPDGYSVVEIPDKTIVDVETNNEGTKTDKVAHIVFDVEDTTLASLPETGGIGTTIFTIGGCVIMIAAAGLYFASRRKHGEN